MTDPTNQEEAVEQAPCRTCGSDGGTIECPDCDEDAEEACPACGGFGNIACPDC